MAVAKFVDAPSRSVGTATPQNADESTGGCGTAILGDMTHDVDQHWMNRALDCARRAAELGEVPVGAVLVREGSLVADGFNRPISGHDPSAHAEMVALRAAAQMLGNYRLPGTTLYVTLEPCAMCAGAIIHARVQRLVFGAADPKAGAVNSVYDLIANPRLNHAVQWTGGVRETDCGELLRQFFRARRAGACATPSYPSRECR